jgi:hypothetical protein
MPHGSSSRKVFLVHAQPFVALHREQHHNGSTAIRDSCHGCFSQKNATECPRSIVGHSRPGRASSNSGHVRYAAECGSKFRRLATPLRAVNRIRLLPSSREVQRMEVAICWPAEYLAALYPLLCAVNAVALAHSLDRDAGWIAAKRGGYADTWREQHDQGCDTIARGLRSCRVPV